MKYLDGVSNYDKYPTTKIVGYDDQVCRGYEEITTQIKKRLVKENSVICIDCTVGVNEEEIIKGLEALQPVNVISSIDIFYDSEKMNQMLYHNVGDDRVFGIAYYGKWMDFVNQEKLKKVQAEVEATKGLTIIIGVGASYIHPGDVQIFADMTIWEIQMRYRNDKIDNFNAQNYEDETSKKFKRGYFVDWRLSNIQKNSILKTFDFYLDTVSKNDPKMVTREAFDNGLMQLLNQPFRTVPFFDEGLWGGQWMKEVMDIEDKEKINYAWSYNCLFPENEVNLTFNGIHVNVPGYTVCMKSPKELIGAKGFARFGAEFPIRFDFLDTVEGGNLSLQVHPNAKYFNENFGMSLTQDESYYFMDCVGDETYMYLGLSDEAKKEDMERDLKRAENGGIDFPAEKYVNKVPVKKHEHYHIPAGTVHCSGANTMVLEISSTPCIFTFKLWDWGRVGLDGKPRPINIDRGMEVVQWDKHKDWAMETCAFKPVLISEGEGYREEKTGMHEHQYIETRRFWQSVKTTHHTNNETNVLNLIEGISAKIESPTNQFEPFIMHYAESIVIPATIETYTITPCGDSEGKEIGVIKAFVRF